MKLRVIVSALSLSIVGLVGSGTRVGAAEIPASPMDFRVQVTSGEMMDPPECDPSPAEIGAKLMMGGSVDMTCTMDRSLSNSESSGTVSNPTLAESDEGFNDGTITQTCDMDQQLEMVMSVGTENKMKKFKGKMFQACAWTMEFTDEESSTLSGTMEMNGTMGSDDGSVTDGNVTFQMTMKVYMVDGSGVFEGYTGGGEFTRTETMDMGMNGGPGGQGGSGAAGQDPTQSSVPPSGGATSGGGSGQMPAGVQEFCTKNGISPCDQNTVQQYCQTNMSACSSLMKQSVRTFSAVSSRVRAFADDNAMTMKLKKGAGAVRILSPAAPTGQPNGVAVVGSSTKIELVATAGANCMVKTNRGKTIATKRVASSDLTILRPKAGAFTGVTSIRAVCKIGSASVTSNMVKVKARS